jgi:tetratricopeptide (TPR) repeat protein
MYIAATGLIILSVSVAFYFFLPRSPGEKLFCSYYEPYGVDKITGISRSPETENLAPVLLYIQGKYDRAIPGFSKYLEKNPSDFQVRLLLAVCLTEDKQYAEAEKELMGMVEAGDHFYREDAGWYLALLSIRKGDIQKAVEHLERIENSRIYGSRVKSLTEEIEKDKQKE